jgi:hypothetical protein
MSSAFAHVLADCLRSATTLCESLVLLRAGPALDARAVDAAAALIVAAAVGVSAAPTSWRWLVRAWQLGHGAGRGWGCVGGLARCCWCCRDCGRGRRRGGAAVDDAEGNGGGSVGCEPLPPAPAGSAVGETAPTLGVGAAL